jgi:hypothetical protein
MTLSVNWIIMDLIKHFNLIIEWRLKEILNNKFWIIRHVINQIQIKISIFLFFQIFDGLSYNANNVYKYWYIIYWVDICIITANIIQL